jgi:predicted PurR-regulated permease PerM
VQSSPTAQSSSAAKKRDPVARGVVVAVGIVGAVAIAVLAVKPLLMLFAGVLFALVLRGVSDAVAKRTHVPYGVCLVVLLLLLFGTAGTTFVVAGPELRDQIADLVARLPAAAHEFLARIHAHGAWQVLGQAASEKGADAGTFARGAFTFVVATLDVVTAIVLFLFVGIYGASRPRDYVRAAMLVAPPGRRLRVRRALRRISHNLTRWLVGRLIAMLFVGITCAIAFSVLDVPLALTLALLAGLLTFIEYIGALVSAIPPTLLAFTQSPKAALGVVLVFTGIHVVEGYILTPLLARASVHFPPALTLGGQVIAVTLIGPLGLTFSTPLLIVAVSIGQVLRGEREPRKRHGHAEARLWNRLHRFPIGRQRRLES